jgi:hypothetical protein
VWPEIRRYLRRFPSAVLSGVDSTGYPVSIRCQPEPDEQLKLLRITIPNALGLQPGPASILCHSHNLFLWNLHSFLIRGLLEVHEGSYRFRPFKFVPGIGVGGLPGMLRFARSKRRAASRYLEVRGLTRPRIPWDELRRIQQEIKRSS